MTGSIIGPVGENLKKKKIKKIKITGSIIGPAMAGPTGPFATALYNRTMESERMPEEWRDSVLIPIFKNKGDVQSCSNYRGIKLIGHTMKLWERIIERRLRRDLTFSNQQYGFMPGKSTTDALFALRVLMEKYREGQKELHCVFVEDRL